MAKIKKDYQESWDRLYEEKYKEAYNEFDEDAVDIEWGYNPVCQLSLSYNGHLEDVDVDDEEFYMQMDDYFNDPENCFDDLRSNFSFYCEEEFNRMREAYADAVASEYADENAEEDEEEEDDNDSEDSLYYASFKKMTKMRVQKKYREKPKSGKFAEINKKLDRMSKFTKFTKEEDDDDGDDSARNTGHPADWELEDEEEEEETDKGCKGCKSEKFMDVNINGKKKSRKMKKGEDMPEDADDQQDQNEKGSGSAGKELPEDADDQMETNEKGSGNAGKELPEDADEQENVKESRRKGVRKFSVTNGGSPDQTSYIQRYNQNPMVRNAIDGRSNVEKFDEVSMMQERIDNLRKSKRNPSNDNGVPKRLR